MAKILIATEKPFAKVAVDGIKEVAAEAGVDVVMLEKYTDKAQLLSAVADVEAIIIRSDKIDNEVFDAAKNLKIVVRAGAGYDNVDLDAATAHGVVVMNTPGQNANAVAELVFCYAFYKKLCLEYPEISFAMDISDVWDGRFERGAEFLRVFPNVEIQEATAGEILQTEHKFTFRYRGKGSRLIRKGVDSVNARYMRGRKKYCVTEDVFEEKKRIISENEWGNIFYFDGFWQNIEYYRPYIEQLQNDFVFAGIDDEKNRDMVKKI